MFLTQQPSSQNETTKHKANYVPLCSKSSMAPISHKAKASPYGGHVPHHTLLAPAPHYSSDLIFYFLHPPLATLPSWLCFKNMSHVSFSECPCLLFPLKYSFPRYLHTQLSPFMSLSKIQLLSNHFPLPQ